MGQAKQRKEEIKQLKLGNENEIIVSDLFLKIAKTTLLDFNSMVRSHPEKDFHLIRDEIQNIIKHKKLTIMNISNFTRYLLNSNLCKEAKESLKINPNMKVEILGNSNKSLGFEHLIMLNEIQKYFDISELDCGFAMTKRDEPLNNTEYHIESVISA